jgi:hypothetical protein
MFFIYRNIIERIFSAIRLILVQCSGEVSGRALGISSKTAYGRPSAGSGSRAHSKTRPHISRISSQADP